MINLHIKSINNYAYFKEFFKDLKIFMRNSKSLKIANESGSTLTFTNFGASLKSWVIELNDKTISRYCAWIQDEINYEN